MDVRLSARADEGVVDDRRWDTVFLATGAGERRLEIPGLEPGRCLTALEYLEGRPTGQRLLVVGGGLTGAEIAYDAASRGKQVTLIEAADTLLNVEGLCAANYNMLLDLLDYHQVEILTGTVAQEARGESVRLVRTLRNYPNQAGRCRRYTAIGPAGRREELTRRADSVVVAIGYRSGAPLRAPEQDSRVVLLGDAVSPGSVLTSIWSAWEAARKV